MEKKLEESHKWEPIVINWQEMMKKCSKILLPACPLNMNKGTGHLNFSYSKALCRTHGCNNRSKHKTSIIFEKYTHHMFKTKPKQQKKPNKLLLFIKIRRQIWNYIDIIKWQICLNETNLFHLFYKLFA